MLVPRIMRGALFSVDMQMFENSQNSNMETRSESSESKNNKKRDRDRGVQTRQKLKMVSLNRWMPWKILDGGVTGNCTLLETVPEQGIYRLTAEKDKLNKRRMIHTHTHNLYRFLVWHWVLLFIFLCIEATHIIEICQSTVKLDQCALELNGVNSSK